MAWLWRLLANWRISGQGRVRRVVVVGFDGLEPALVDHYLEQGLLHNLALLGDVGTRAAWVDSRPFDAASLAATIGGHGVRAVVLPALHAPGQETLQAICADDGAQQERLIAALARSRRGVIVCVFDMPARLQILFGPHPDEGQRSVLRDVYARMDEIVGKAFSFVDDRTVLLAAIPSSNVAGAATESAARGLIFASCPLDVAGPAIASLPSTVLNLLGVAERGN
ncbi:MAG: hypothetical protein WD971_01065 [Pirellulales bacterium]